MCDMVDLKIYRILIWRWYLTGYYFIINIACVFTREHLCPLAEQSFDFVSLHEIYNWQCASTDLARIYPIYTRLISRFQCALGTDYIYCKQMRIVLYWASTV